MHGHMPQCLTNTLIVTEWGDLYTQCGSYIPRHTFCQNLLPDTYLDTTVSWLPPDIRLTVLRTIASQPPANSPHTGEGEMPVPYLFSKQLSQGCLQTTFPPCIVQNNSLTAACKQTSRRVTNASVIPITEQLPHSSFLTAVQWRIPAEAIQRLVQFYLCRLPMSIEVMKQLITITRMFLLL